MKYILDERGDPVPCPDVVKWAKWFSTTDHRQVLLDKLPTAQVSTIFLGLDYSLTKPPVLWETKVLGGKLDGEIQRYTSHADAVSGHHSMVERVRRAG